MEIPKDLKREKKEKEIKTKNNPKLEILGVYLSKRTLFLNFTMGVFKKWACLEKKRMGSFRFWSWICNLKELADEILCPCFQKHFGAQMSLSMPCLLVAVLGFSNPKIENYVWM